MRTIALGYMFAGVNIAFQGIFQAMGKGGYSLIISLIRMVIISLPIAWIVVQFVPNKELVFIAFPVAELLAAIVSYLLYLHDGKNLNEEESGQEELVIS